MVPPFPDQSGERTHAQITCLEQKYGPSTQFYSKHDDIGKVMVWNVPARSSHWHEAQKQTRCQLHVNFEGSSHPKLNLFLWIYLFCEKSVIYSKNKLIVSLYYKHLTFKHQPPPHPTPTLPLDNTVHYSTHFSYQGYQNCSLIHHSLMIHIQST